MSEQEIEKLREEINEMKIQKQKEEIISCVSTNYVFSSLMVIPSFLRKPSWPFRSTALLAETSSQTPPSISGPHRRLGG